MSGIKNQDRTKTVQHPPSAVMERDPDEEEDLSFHSVNHQNQIVAEQLDDSDDLYSEDNRGFSKYRQAPGEATKLPMAVGLDLTNVRPSLLKTDKLVNRMLELI